MKKIDPIHAKTFNINTDLTKYGPIFQHALSKIYLSQFSPKEKIINFSDSVDTLYFLIKGKAKIYMIHEDGKQSLIQFLEPGDFIGELTLLDIETQPKDVVAISECVCLSLPISHAKELLLSDHDFLTYLTKYLALKLLKRTEFFSKNQSYEFKNRLATYILLSQHDLVYSEKHTETAEFLGVSYRHLLHTLKKFQEEGLLYKQKKGYLINYDKLSLLSAMQN